MIMTNNFINRRIRLIYNPVTLDQGSSHVYGGHRGDCPQENRRGYPLPTHRGEEMELNQSSLVCSLQLYKLYQETYHSTSICIYVVEGVDGQAKSSEITLIQLLSQGKEYQSFSKQTNHVEACLKCRFVNQTHKDLIHGFWGIAHRFVFLTFASSFTGPEASISIDSWTTLLETVNYSMLPIYVVFFFFFEGKPNKIMEVKYIITQLFIITSVIISSLNSDTAYSLVHRVITVLKEILLPSFGSKDV